MFSLAMECLLSRRFLSQGEGTNVLLEDLDNASVLLTSANKTITSYGAQAGLALFCI